MHLFCMQSSVNALKCHQRFSECSQWRIRIYALVGTAKSKVASEQITVDSDSETMCWKMWQTFYLMQNNKEFWSQILQPKLFGLRQNRIPQRKWKLLENFFFLIRFPIYVWWHRESAPYSGISFSRSAALVCLNSGLSSCALSQFTVKLTELFLFIGWGRMSRLQFQSEWGLR